MAPSRSTATTGGMAFAHQHGRASGAGVPARGSAIAIMVPRKLPICREKGLGTVPFGGSDGLVCVPPADGDTFEEDSESYRVRPYSPVTDRLMASSKPSG
jgi:hypothetical protein